MISESINAQRQSVEAKIVELEQVYSSKTAYTFTDDSVIEKYQALLEKSGLLRGKKKKKNTRELSNLISEYKHLKQDIHNIDAKVAAKEDLNIFKKKLININLYVKEEVVILIDILEKEGFIETIKEEITEEIKEEITDTTNTTDTTETTDNNNITKTNEKIVLTEKGDIANNIQELHSLAMADVLNNRIFDNLDPVEFVSVLSAFAHISIPADQKVDPAAGQTEPERWRPTAGPPSSGRRSRRRSSSSTSWSARPTSCGARRTRWGAGRASAGRSSVISRGG
jgi:superfamily II RNA helicase